MKRKDRGLISPGRTLPPDAVISFVVTPGPSIGVISVLFRSTGGRYDADDALVILPAMFVLALFGRVPGAVADVPDSRMDFLERGERERGERLFAFLLSVSRR